MSIVYALVGSRGVILAEKIVPSISGNLQKVAESLMKKVGKEQDQVLFYIHEEHNIHVLIEDGFEYVCFATKAFGRTIPLEFLKAVKESFLSKFGGRTDQKNKTLMFDTDFKSTLRELMANYGSRINTSDKMGAVKSELEKAKHVMEQNIDKAINRGDRLDELVDRSEHLRDHSIQFSSSARSIRRQMCWSNYKSVLSFILLFCVIAWLVITFLLCGGIKYPKCQI